MDDHTIPYEQRNEAKDLRVAVKLSLYDSGILTHGRDNYRDPKSHASLFLCDLFGYQDYGDLARASILDLDFIHKLKMLAGPNTYAVYKAMLAKSSDDTSCNRYMGS